MAMYANPCWERAAQSFSRENLLCCSVPSLSTRQLTMSWRTRERSRRTGGRGRCRRELGEDSSTTSSHFSPPLSAAMRRMGQSGPPLSASTMNPDTTVPWGSWKVRWRCLWRA
eukprot:123344-Hanusia_phi.AAC.1